MDENYTIDSLLPFPPSYMALDRARLAVTDMLEEVNLTQQERQVCVHWLTKADTMELEVLGSLFLKFWQLRR